MRCVLRKLWRRFSTVRGHRVIWIHWSFPGLDTLRHWLDELGINFFECDSCRPCICRICRISTAFLIAKLDLVDNVVLFLLWRKRSLRRCSGLSADLSAINASSLTVEAFLDIQDDNLPKLVVCQALSV